MESIALNYKYVYPFIQFWYCFEIYNRYITEKRILEISGQGGQNNLSAKGSGMWVVTCNSCLQVTTGSRRMWKHPLKLQWKYISNLEFPRSKSLMPRSAGRYFQVASRFVRAECAETVLHHKTQLKGDQDRCSFSGCWRDMESSQRKVLGRSRRQLYGICREPKVYLERVDLWHGSLKTAHSCICGIEMKHWDVADSGWNSRKVKALALQGQKNIMRSPESVSQ